jgi:hypothetical protein
MQMVEMAETRSLHLLPAHHKPKALAAAAAADISLFRPAHQHEIQMEGITVQPILLL